MKSLRKVNSAFTLIEVMVSSALIVVIMGFLMYTMEQTQRTMRGADSRVGQFQTARVAFEAMTRNLSQATLNTYWDVDMSVDGQGRLVPMGYRRNSDLHFVSGLAAQARILDTNSRINPTHAVFFQAPLGVSFQDDGTIVSRSGYTEDPDAAVADEGDAESAETKRKYRFLNGLMNVCGYFVEWNEDSRIPTFITEAEKGTTSAQRNRRFRYRLMEVVQPAETVALFNTAWYTKPGGRTDRSFQATPAVPGVLKDSFLNATDWIKVAVGKMDPTLGARKNYARPLADNIVAMIIVPKLPDSERTGFSSDDPRLDDLSTDFEYDTRPQVVYDASHGGAAGTTGASKTFIDGTAQLEQLFSESNSNRRGLIQYAQLPPILQVTLIAIDEESGGKLESSLGEPETGPDAHWADGLFDSLGTEQDLIKEFGKPSNPDASSLLGRFIGKDKSLELPKVNYRVFTTDVVMRSAKWSNPKAAQ